MRFSRLQLRTFAPPAVAALLAAAGAASVAPSSAADTTTCLGRLPTIVATADGETIAGTDGDDVIVAWGFAGVSVQAGAGNDRICGDPAVVDGGEGDDAIVAVGGVVSGGAGNDVISHAGGTTDGGPGDDRLVQRQLGAARGGEGDDAVAARIRVGAVDPALPPWETAAPGGAPVFELAGDAGADLLTVTAPTDGTTDRRCPACKLRVDGGDGDDTVAVRGDGARIHLQQGRARFAGTTVRLREVENVIGTAGPDLIVGDAGRNTLSGKGGRDRIYGGPGGDLLLGGAGRDLLVGQGGLDGAQGGRAVDRCLAELSQNC